jgi:hypothetical protein
MACDGITEYNDVPGAIRCSSVGSCGQGQRVVLQQTAINDVACDFCPEREYNAKEDHQDSECTAVTVCAAGTREVAARQLLVADVDCIPCEVGKEWQNGTAQLECLPVSGCFAGSYIDAVATALSDRVCGNCEVGISFQDASNASGCKPITDERCPRNSTIYEVAATVSSDRECRTHTVCEDGEAIGTPGTNISDTICVVKSVAEKEGGGGGAAAVIIVVLLLLALGIGVFVWKRKQARANVMSGLREHRRATRGATGDGRNTAARNTGAARTKRRKPGEQTVASTSNPSYTAEPTYGNDAPYEVLPGTDDGNEFYEDVQVENGAAPSISGASNPSYHTQNPLEETYDVMEQHERPSNEQQTFAAMLSGTPNPSYEDKPIPAPSKKKRTGKEAVGAAVGAGSRTKATKCLRLAPSGRNCTNPLVEGFSYCIKHKCPAAGCTDGKGSKEESCAAHEGYLDIAGTQSRPLVVVDDRYSGYAAPPAKVKVAPIEKYGGYKPKDAAHAAAFDESAQEAYDMPGAETDDSAQPYLQPSGGEEYLMPGAGGGEEYEVPVGMYQKLEGNGGGITSYNANDYKEGVPGDEMYEPVEDENYEPLDGVDC